jgi:hypothetical protein
MFVLETKFIPNPAGIANLLESPTGTLGLWLQSRAEAVEQVARAKCPVRSGALRDSISAEVVVGPPLTANVTAGGPNAPYASFVHDGTEEHWIEPSSANVLAFPAAKRATRGKRKGQPLKSGAQTIVFSAYADHPGNAANPFLSESLTAVMGVLQL